MTEAAFRKALRNLAKPGAAAEREFRRLPPDAWTGWMLTYGPQLLYDRRRTDATALLWLGAVLLAGLALFVHYHLPGPLFVGYAVAAAWLTWDLVGWTRRRPPNVLPLLVRLDDVALTPLWLDVLPEGDDDQRRILYERLTRHLTEYTPATGWLLPASAKSALRDEIRLLCPAETLHPREIAFLTAALIALDDADANTLGAIAALHDLRDAHLHAAAEDALVRLRR